MIAATPLEEIHRSLNWWLLRLRLRDAVVWGVRGLSGGLAVGLGIALVARFRPLLTASELAAICAGLGTAGLLLFGAGAWFWPRNRLNAARFFDRLYDLRERTSTALEIATGKLGAPARLREQQLDDTLSAVRAVDAVEGLPIQIARVEWLTAVVLMAAIGAAVLLPNAQEGRLAEQRAVAQAIEQSVQQIEAIRQTIQDNPALSEEQKSELSQPLEEAQRQLQESELTREQAVAVLTQAEQQLEQLADPQAQEQIQALQTAGEGLANNATTESLGDNLAAGDLQAAARDLASLDTTDLSQSERASLAQELEQAASSLEATNPDLAGQLQQAADALRQGDTEAAQGALDQAAETLSQTSSQLAESQAAAQAASQVGQSRQDVARAGQAQQSATGDPGQGQPGQGQQGQQGQGQGQQGQGQGEGQGAGQGQGQGSSQEQSQGQGAGGAGRGESNGQAQGGQAGLGPSNDNGPGDGGERGYEPIYAPSRLGGSGGPEVNLDGSGDPGDEVIGQGNVNPQEQAGDVTVPYNEVYSGYNQAAHDAIRSGDVPIGLRPVVRDYFSSLEP